MDPPKLDGKLVGKIIKEFRKKQKLSQYVVSERAGIDRTHLSAIEHGVRRPNLETFYNLCCAMGVKMETVMRELESRI